MKPDSSAGRLVWIGLRPGRREPVQCVESACLEPGKGLVGDHYRPRRDARRQVTLVCHEHLGEMAARLERGPIDPALLRRNLVVSGIDLTRLEGVRFQIGVVLLEGTGPCTPCSRMDEALGQGGRMAMKGFGGITAVILSGGTIRLGDAVEPRAAEGETASPR